MRYIFLFVLAIAVLGCSKSPEGHVTIDPPQKGGTKSIEGLDRYALGSPVSYHNVTIVPIVLTSSEKIQKEDYVSLAEAKRNGWVEISEMPTGQEVSRLYVRNLAKKPLLLLSGELLLGGKQDRVVAKDTVVPPGEEMAVPVFCVEHGRWTGETSKFDYSDSMAPQSVRKMATFGSQQQVWDEVGDYNKRAKAEPETSSVRGGLYNQEVQSRIDDDLKNFTQALDSQDNVVGLVYVVNGEIGSFELFGSPELLNSTREALLRGFLADAAVHASADAKPADLDGVASFVKQSLTGERQQSGLARGNGNWNVSNGGIAGRESTLPAAAAPSEKAAPDSSTFLHGSYSPNK